MDLRLRYILCRRINACENCLESFKALNLLEEKELYVYCGQLRLIRSSFDNGLNGRSGNGLVVKHNCDIKCNDTSEHGKASGIDEPENSCTLTIGGPKNYVPVVCVLYLCTIIFYDLQKVGFRFVWALKCTGDVRFSSFNTPFPTKTERIWPSSKIRPRRIWSPKTPTKRFWKNSSTEIANRFALWRAKV